MCLNRFGSQTDFFTHRHRRTRDWRREIWVTPRFLFQVPWYVACSTSTLIPRQTRTQQPHAILLTLALLRLGRGPKLKWKNKREWTNPICFAACVKWFSRMIRLCFLVPFLVHDPTSWEMKRYKTGERQRSNEDLLDYPGWFSEDDFFMTLTRRRQLNLQSRLTIFRCVWRVDEVKRRFFVPIYHALSSRFLLNPLYLLLSRL